MQPGTTTELNLADWFRSQGIAFKPVVVERLDEIIRSFAVAAATPSPATNPSWPPRGTLANPDQYVILPENFSKEPLGPMVRQGDEQWFNIVRWTMYAMMEAEEYGITSKNVDEMLKSTNNVQRLLGVTPGMGRTWAWMTSGPTTSSSASATTAKAEEPGRGPLKLPRGLNASYRDGGLITAGRCAGATAPMTAPTNASGRRPLLASLLTTGNHRGNARRL